MQNAQKNFLIASIIPHHISDIDAFNDLKEIKQLIDTYGGHVSDFITQHREIHDKGPFIGRGKIKEISALIKKDSINVIVLNALVKPGHIFDMKKIWLQENPDIQVWDKIDLILNIFSKNASTAEAKLQIELAAMRHMGPRIYGMGQVMSRQAGSIGTRGIGETNTELMKRHWREQIKAVKDKIKKLENNRRSQLLQRQRGGFKTVSLIGYTNAGKTSLFNLLTKKSKKIQNALFVTLDSNVGKIYSPKIHKQILITDTIGFINNLPADLIEAFKSTLLESIHADVLLQAIDLSDENLELKIQTVESILNELQIADKKRIYVFNKIDKCPNLDKKQLIKKYSVYNPQFISTITGHGLEDMLSQIEKTLTP